MFMNELTLEQICPYCDHTVEDSQSNWSEDEEIVTCSNCEKEYAVSAVYDFEGFKIERKCETCGEWTDDGYKLCDCDYKYIC